MAIRILVALQVVVGTDPVTGFAQYPNFNLISNAIRKGMDWSKYLDVYGGGMHYDKTSGHKEESVASPYGQQICSMTVPEDFAEQAVSLFPTIVTAMTPTEFETFHDTKAHAHEPDDVVDTDALNGLNTQRALMTAISQDTTVLDAKIVRALDRTDRTENGVKENIRKRWSGASIEKGITLKVIAT